MSRTSPIKKRLHQNKSTERVVYLCGLCHPLIPCSRCCGRRAHPYTPALHDVALPQRRFSGQSVQARKAMNGNGNGNGNSNSNGNSGNTERTDVTDITDRKAPTSKKVRSQLFICAVCVIR